MASVYSSLGYRKIIYVLCALLILTPVKSHATAAAACSLANTTITQGHATAIQQIGQRFNTLRNQIVTSFFQGQVLPALQQFATEMSSVAMHQTMVVGTFFDAKHQLETQRLFQELQVQAHKDYQPSTSFCAFGTNVRSLATSESASRYNALAMSQRQMARHLGQTNMAAAGKRTDDINARWEQFVTTYCDPKDNNWRDGVDDSGLTDADNASIPYSSPFNAGTQICRNDKDTEGDDIPRRPNIDIDYTRLIENRRVLDVASAYDIGSRDEVDVQALGNNLFGHRTLSREATDNALKKDSTAEAYMALRSVAAKRSVAENSFNNIVSLKSLGNADGLYDEGGAPGNTQTTKFLGAVLVELGMSDDDIVEYLSGDPDLNPDFSYYAMLEILAKKIYQNPDFYANLYDKPANVKRVSAALKAIELMLDREIFESQLRQEMSMSVLLSSRLDLKFDDLNKELPR